MTWDDPTTGIDEAEGPDEDWEYPAPEGPASTWRASDVDPSTVTVHPRRSAPPGNRSSSRGTTASVRFTVARRALRSSSVCGAARDAWTFPTLVRLRAGVAAKRSRQLNRGAPPRVESRHKKPTSGALEEIAAAKVEYRVKDEGDAPKA